MNRHKARMNVCIGINDSLMHLHYSFVAEIVQLKIIIHWCRLFSIIIMIIFSLFIIIIIIIIIIFLFIGRKSYSMSKKKPKKTIIYQPSTRKKNLGGVLNRSPTLNPTQNRSAHGRWIIIKTLKKRFQNPLEILNPIKKHLQTRKKFLLARKKRKKKR